MDRYLMSCAPPSLTKATIFLFLPLSILKFSKCAGPIHFHIFISKIWIDRSNPHAKLAEGTVFYCNCKA